MKSILAIADGGPTLEATVAAGAFVAGLVEGHLDVLHVRDSASVISNLAVVGAESGGAALVIEDRQGTVAERAARARRAYDAFAALLARSDFVDRDCNEAAIVVELGRVSDLLVVGRPRLDARKPEPTYVRAAIYDRRGRS